ncbi:MAG TPA: amidohydrolase family protein [Blastocatellia bacterium]|nr:amidohydrolase family protein [Blastocatellia bacterium]
MTIQLSRRAFLATASAALVATVPNDTAAKEPIIDIHQHTHYSGRSDADLLAHQRTMGVAKTVLLPAGSLHGLEADAWGNDSCLALVKKYPKEYYFFANELPDIAETRTVIEKYLKLGAIGIGEQKYFVDADSRHIELIATLAQEYNVPVLLHFQHGKYNMNFARFHKILEKFPRVNFIGHAQTWWGNIDHNHDQQVMYPKTKVTAGGWSDRWMRDYPNMFGDLSAGSGLNALQRDEDHAREFLKRHQDKLLYGSDCNDTVGQGEKCSGAQQIATVRRLVSDPKIQRKIFYQNARRIMRIK